MGPGHVDRGGIHLCIVSGMDFYIDSQGHYYVNRLQDVLEEITRYFSKVTYYGVCRGKAAPGMHRITNPNIRVVAPPGVGRGWLRICWYIVRDLVVGVRAVKDSDVVLTKLSGYRGVVGFFLARLCRKPVATYLITDPAFVAPPCGRIEKWVKSRIREAIWSWVFRSGDLRCYMSPTWAEKYLGGTDAPRSLHYVESVVNSPRTEARRFDHVDKWNLLYVGALTETKNPLMLLDVAVKLRERGLRFELHIAGAGSLEGPMREKTERLGLQDCVLFHGFVPQGEKLWSLYRRAHLFVFPTRSDAFGLVLVEAMAHGLPIVATRVGGIPDLICEGENGFLVPPDDTEAFAGAVAYLLNSHDLMRMMSARNLERARNFDVRDQTKRLCDAVGELVGA